MNINLKFVFVGLFYLFALPAASMNNLNDPPRWNIQPEQGRGDPGAGGGSQWNYALLVPMLGLAAFRKLNNYIPLKVLGLGVFTLD